MTLEPHHAACRRRTDAEHAALTVGAAFKPDGSGNPPQPASGRLLGAGGPAQPSKINNSDLAGLSGATPTTRRTSQQPDTEETP